MLFTLSTEHEEVESIPEKQLSPAVPVHRGLGLATLHISQHSSQKLHFVIDKKVVSFM